jgi:hemerythrin-like domain-containing protein
MGGAFEAASARPICPGSRRRDCREPILNLDLQSRNGWPDELRLLIDRYPREVWTGHANLGEMARFWLDRHQGFRDLGKALSGATSDFHQGKTPPETFRRFFAPRLQFLLQNLEGHHQIEDLHFFPLFRAAEQRLMKGFDVLEGDHEAIHAEIMRTVESANELLRTIESSDDVRRKATDSYAGASEKLLKFLVRHLDDEEDLIMPVILDQGERKLFGMQY